MLGRLHNPALRDLASLMVNRDLAIWSFRPRRSFSGWVPRARSLRAPDLQRRRLPHRGAGGRGNVDIDRGELLGLLHRDWCPIRALPPSPLFSSALAMASTSPRNPLRE